MLAEVFVLILHLIFIVAIYPIIWGIYKIIYSPATNIHKSSQTRPDTAHNLRKTLIPLSDFSMSHN